MVFTLETVIIICVINHLFPQAMTEYLAYLVS